jgi:crotonobetainyl-CoA:carnitine CoA-transferase CaiB-like acyl-CoA transferase
MGPEFASSNRSKRSFGADLGTESGLELVKALVRNADIVVENLPTGVLDGFGLGWDVIHQLNPGALMISSQTMGSRGPWKDWRGYGPNTRPPGGMSYLWGFPGMDRPMPSSSAFPDHIVGRLGAAVAAAFMIGRPRIDQGIRIEIVQAEVAINLLSDLLLKESIEPGSAQPQGNRSLRGAPWGVYPCAGEQRWCVVTCQNDQDWEGLKAALGHPAWADEASYASAGGRRSDQDAIDSQLSAWTAQRSDTDVMHTLQSFGVPAGKMMYTADLATDPHLLSRGYVRKLEQPPLGTILVEGPAFHAADLTGPITVTAPAVGEHTRQICEDVLGLGPDEVDRLVAEGVLYENHGADAS